MPKWKGTTTNRHVIDFIHLFQGSFWSQLRQMAQEQADQARVQRALLLQAQENWVAPDNLGDEFRFSSRYLLLAGINANSPAETEDSMMGAAEWAECALRARILYIDRRLKPKAVGFWWRPFLVHSSRATLVRIKKLMPFKNGY